MGLCTCGNKFGYHAVTCPQPPSPIEPEARTSLTSKYSLFMSVLARDGASGGGSFQALKAETVEDARAEAKAIMEKCAPEGGCDFDVDYAAIVETPPFFERLR